MDSEFRKFRDEKYFKLINPEVKYLIRKVNSDAPNGPFLTWDISELILLHFSYLSSRSNEEEVKKIISDAVFFFRKGDKEEIFESLKNKLASR